MPDITMCEGHECPLKEVCYRHKAKPSSRQSYFWKPPYNKDKVACDHYWEINKGEDEDTD